jgi:RsiW-degrading membrane proteinase PrsW (M82 family)
MNKRTVRWIMNLGWLLVTAGTFVLLTIVCSLSYRTSISENIAALTALVLTLGAGGVVAWHASRSLKAVPSGLVRLVPIPALIGIFVLLLFLMTNSISAPWFASHLFVPPAMLVAALLPPLWSLSWFMGQDPGGVTWRRGLVALAGGATLGVLVALILEILFPTIILALVFDLADPVLDRANELLSALADRDIASAFTSSGFVYAFVQLAIIAPLAEELAKPLVTFPLLRHLNRRDAFLVGAFAGAGFAALENVIYATSGISFAIGILAVRALGGAVHPLGAGFVALGWRRVLNGEPGAGSTWLRRFAAAAGVHALWNGGSLIVITLAGAEFFGAMPPELDLLGVSAAGITLALLVVLGLGALWAGRSLARDEDRPLVVPAPPSDRAIAIWAFACLLVLVPAGIASLKLLFR